MKTVKKVAAVSAIMATVAAFYVAPAFADSDVEASGISDVLYAYFHPNDHASIHHGNFTVEDAKEWNFLISVAWNSPFSNHLPGTLSAPLGIDTSEFKYDINTDEVIGTNEGYNQPMGYGDTCEKPTFYTKKVDIPTPLSCPAPDDDDHDNGHGNDDDHDDDSNPGHGGGGHGA
jgi:hypothetical protein